MPSKKSQDEQNEAAEDEAVIRTDAADDASADGEIALGGPFDEASPEPEASQREESTHHGTVKDTPVPQPPQNTFETHDSAPNSNPREVLRGLIVDSGLPGAEALKSAAAPAANVESEPVVVHRQTVLDDGGLYRVKGTVDGQDRTAYVATEVYDLTQPHDGSRFALIKNLLLAATE